MFRAAELVGNAEDEGAGENQPGRSVNFFMGSRGFDQFTFWKVLLVIVQRTYGDQGKSGLQRPVSCLDTKVEAGGEKH